MTGDNARKLNGSERADLLCFLVMAQLIGHASNGGWLRTDHVVEAARMWAASNAADCDWLERAKLARMSADLAPQFRVFPRFPDPVEILKLSRTDGSWITGRRPCAACWMYARSI
jgi:hypothetical protein